MPKKSLEQAIEMLARDFAIQLVNAVKQSSLEELISIQTGGKPARKPGPKRGRAKAATTIKKKTGVKAAKKTVKKRKKGNYPKCKIASCGRTMWARGKGFCGTHYKDLVAGKIDADGKKITAAK